MLPNFGKHFCCIRKPCHSGGVPLRLLPVSKTRKGCRILSLRGFSYLMLITTLQSPRYTRSQLPTGSPKTLVVFWGDLHRGAVDVGVDLYDSRAFL